MKFHYLSVCFLGFALLCAVQVGFAKDEGKSAGAAGIEKATFAGGCFWCMVPPFDNLPGVVSVTSGYTGGHKVNPTYEEVSGGTTGRAESVQIVYDPSKIGYGELLDIFWHNIDPLARDRQFCDEGNQYRSAIFFHNEEQSRLAEASKKVLEESPRFKGKVIYTGVVPASEFYPAEAYHQKYYKTHSLRYKAYRYSCGRDQRLKEIWGKQPH